MRAVIDRFEGNKAVLLYGDGDTYKMALLRKFLPKEAEEGAVLHIEISYDEKATQEELQESLRLLDELKKDQL